MHTLRFLIVFSFLVAALAHGDATDHAHTETEEEMNEFDRDHENAGILTLTDENFNATIASHPAVLVKFYAPWCIHSRALAPEYVKAGLILKSKNSTIRLARMDASLEKKTAERYGVKGHPTLKYFKGDAVAEYNGGKIGEAIASWVQVKLLPATVKLSTVEEAEKFAASQSATVLGLFAGGADTAAVAEKAHILEEAAFTRLDEIPVGVVDSAEILAHFGVTEDTVILFKNIDNERLQFQGLFDVDSIGTFVKKNKLPLVVEFSHATAPDIFGGSITKHALLFVRKSQEDVFKAVVNQLKEPARTFKDRVIFIYVNTDDEANQKILQFFGVKKTDQPSMRIIGLDMNMSKFRPTFEKITSEAITEFVQGVLAGTAEPHLPSQELPADWDKKPVKVLVASNFDEVVMDRAKTVFVMFYAPWCDHSKQLAPIWAQLAEEYATNETIVMAMMDSSENELSDIKVISFPTLKLFPANSNDVFDYYGVDRTLKSLKTFLDSGGRIQPGVNDKGDPPKEDAQTEESAAEQTAAEGQEKKAVVEDATVESEAGSDTKDEL